MLINLSNHPSKDWSKAQIEASKEYGDIIDIPFPNIKPGYSIEDVNILAREYFAKIKETGTPEEAVIHIMGEMTFIYNLIALLLKSGYRCIASTTERIVADNPDGSKNVKFNFNNFRDYSI